MKGIRLAEFGCQDGGEKDEDAEAARLAANKRMARNAELSKMKVSALKKEARTAGVDQVRTSADLNSVRLLLRGSVGFAFLLMAVQMLPLLLEMEKRVAPLPYLRQNCSLVCL